MRGKVTWTSKGPIYEIEGKRVTEKEFDEVFRPKPLDHAPMLGGNTTVCWPQKSDAMACHPSQIPAIMARNKKHGLHVEYNAADGRPILKDRGQRRDLMKLEGFHDNSGGYGDDHHTATVKEEEFKIKEGL